MDNATRKPIPGADAAALLSGRSPSNLSMMFDFITPPERPPAVSPIGSVKNRQTSSTEGFPYFLSFFNKASNSFSNQLHRSSGSFCVKPTRSTCTYLLTTELPEEADADSVTCPISLMSFSTRFCTNISFLSETARFKYLQQSFTEGLPRWEVL